jgi:hypothetical protein
MKKLFLFITLGLLSAYSFAFDFELSSAAKRPGSNEVFVGGTFTTIIVFDISTGKTMRSFEIPEGVNDIQFNKAGDIMIAASSSKAFLVNPDNGTIITTISGGAFQLFCESPYFVDMKKYGDTKAILYNSTTGEKIKEVRTSFQPKVCGFDKEFKTLYILSAKAEIGAEDEQKYLNKKLEKSAGYNCYNSAYTAKQEDKNGSYILKFNIEKNEEISTIICPYDFGGSFAISIIAAGDALYISDWDMLVKIDKNGMSTPIECERAGFAYANHNTSDLKNIIISSTKSGNIYSITESKWIEYNLRDGNEFTYTADIFSTNDRIWLLSKDYTLTSMSYTGEKTQSYKINEGSEKGFSVYYHNGYAKPEDRNLEAAIINAELTKRGLTSIDLEQHIGKSDVVLATFKTVSEAEAFTTIIKDNKLQYITKIAPAK